MVLNKSKWDHKAKIQYLKKHGLTKPKPKEQMTPKWSSKKSSTQNRLILDDSDSEWDSDDEELINHFYPEMSPQDLPIDYKRKLKEQIKLALAAREVDDENDTKTVQEIEEPDGIYLGTKPIAEDVEDDERDTETYEDDEMNFEIPDLETKLSDFLILAKPQRSRKLLKNKMLDNFLEEYGIDNLQTTVKDIDYNDILKNSNKNFDKMDLSKLNGHRIGDSFDKPKESHVRVLSQEEQQDHLDREKKLEHAKFYNQIKTTFGQQNEKSTSKLIEINNFNAEDERQMEALNMRLIREGQISGQKDVDDLDDLLGLSKDQGYANELDNLDDLLKKSRAQSESQASKKTKPATLKLHAQDDFLDDLLGI